MSTQIKKNGNWVTVAGGTRMWVGTKAALQAALNAGELVDGTAVMVTDDYEEGNIPLTYYTPTPSAGRVHPADCWYIRKGNVVTVSIGIADLTVAEPGETVFTLPAGLRPSVNHVIGTCCGNYYSTNGAMQVNQNGDISVTCETGCFGIVTFVVA